MLTDPIFQDGDGWWFWDEIGWDRCGPYSDRLTAEKAMGRYFDSLLALQGHDGKGMYIHLREEDEANE